MNNTPSMVIHYLDPSVEDALYTPGETASPAPAHPVDAMADDLAAEWDGREIRPAWLESL